MRPSCPRGLSLIGVSAAIRAGSISYMPADAGALTAEQDLVRFAVALLGEERVAELSDALEQRAEQLRRVDGAAGHRVDGKRAGERPRSPTPASAANTAGARRRIGELDGHLRAFAWRAPEDEAEDRESTGPCGMLDGYVVGVKDIIDVAGMPTRCGSPLTSGAPASTDATVVARVRDEGAAVIGKTHCTEWALNDPAPTHNPHDPTRTPGGSSSGSAVAVATSMCTATIDTQTAGDVLRPAAFNGVVGYKPTIGWAPSDGIQRVAPTIDTVGVTARCVREAAIVVAAIADGHHRLESPTPRPPRVGLLADPFYASAGPAVTANLTAVTSRLASDGATVDEVRSPVDLFQLHAAHRIITFAECAAQHRGRYRDRSGRYGIRARQLIDLGLATPATAYVDAQHVREDDTERLSALLEEIDVLVTPVTPGPPPARDTTGDSTYQIPWTLCGFPAVALPSGNDDGLPLAVQLVGARARDASLIAHAQWCESVLDVHHASTGATS
jgi:Asp-tRNA(Asn)/Glu-tRNA(Gln) amidotransferase A subunit family amidase